MLKIHAKADTCNWTRTFYLQVIEAQWSPQDSDIKEVWV
jgi:hypothetical protein